MDPLVSIIIPVYNAEPWLRECIDSVLAQTYRNIEVICVNDGSTDSSGEILHGYAEADGRLRVLDQENKFAGAARNLGMDNASGEYLLFLDADDYFDHEMVASLVEAARRDSADIAV